MFARIDSFPMERVFLPRSKVAGRRRSDQSFVTGSLSSAQPSAPPNDGTPRDSHPRPHHRGPSSNPLPRRLAPRRPALYPPRPTHNPAQGLPRPPFTPHVIEHCRNCRLHPPCPPCSPPLFPFYCGLVAYNGQITSYVFGLKTTVISAGEKTTCLDLVKGCFKEDEYKPKRRSTTTSKWHSVGPPRQFWPFIWFWGIDFEGRRMNR